VRIFVVDDNCDAAETGIAKPRLLDEGDVLNEADRALKQLAALLRRI
jgi:hypothetical protein